MRSHRKPARSKQTNADLQGVPPMSHRKSVALSGASITVLATLMLAIPAAAQPVQLGPVSVNDNADKNGLTHAPPLASIPSASIQDTPQAVNVIDSAIMK